MSDSPMDPNEAAEAFWREGYLAVGGFLPESMATLAARYTLMQYQTNPNPEVSRDGRVAQVEGAHSVYADPLAESILDLATADVSAMIGRSLVPTYAFYRVYRPGDALVPHTDRISCEISASMCLGSRLDPDTDPWRLGFRTCDPEPVNVEIEQKPGDLVIYRGCDVIHWRQPFTGSTETWHSQVFLHWVDADGPYADLCRFDCRPHLGGDETAREPDKVRIMNKENDRRNEVKRRRLRRDYRELASTLGDVFDFTPEDGLDVDGRNPPGQAESSE